MSFNPFINPEDEDISFPSPPTEDTNELPSVPGNDTEILNEISEFPVSEDLDSMLDNISEDKRIILGNSIDDRFKVYLDFSTDNQRNLMTGIYGGSGSGKSALAKIFVEHLIQQDIPSIILSAKNDFLNLLNMNDNDDFLNIREAIKENKYIIPISFRSDTGIQIKFPIFDLPRFKDMKRFNIILSEQEIEGRIDASVNLICEYGFKTKSNNYKTKLKLFLNEICKEAWENDFNIYSIQGLREIVSVNSERLKVNKLKGDEIDLGLRTMTVGIKKQIFETGTVFDLNFFLDSSNFNNKTPCNIFLLQELDMEDQEWLVSKVCDMIYAWGSSMGETNAIRMVLVIDEAAMYCPSGNKNTISKQSIDKLVRLARQYGIFVILSTQLPKDLSRAVRGNLGITLFGKSVAENVDVIHENIRDNKLVIEKKIGKNHLQQLNEREFCLVSENQVEFFTSRNTVIDLDFSPSKEYLKKHSKHIEETLPKIIKEIDPFVIPVENEIIRTKSVLEEIEEDKIPNFISINSEKLDFTDMISYCISDKIKYFELLSEKIFYIPFNSITGKIRINSLKLDIHTNIIPENMFTQTRLIPLTKFVPSPVNNTENINIGNLIKLNHITEYEKYNLIQSFDLDTMNPEIIDANTKKIDDNQARILLKQSVKKRIEDSQPLLSLEILNLKEDFNQKVNEFDEKIKESEEKKKPITDAIDGMRNKIKKMIDKKNEAIDIAEKYLIQYKSTKKKVNEINANRYVSMAKQFSAKRKELEIKLRKLEEILVSLELSEDDVKKERDKQIKVRDDRIKLIEKQVSNINKWQFQAKDSISAVETNIIFIPFKLYKYNIMDPNQEKREIFCYQEVHKGSPLYVLCDRHREGNTNSDIHNNLWFCPSCFRLICKNHSQISVRSGNRLCHEHLSTCYDCGVVEKEDLINCDNCSRDFCPDHVSEFVKGTFKKTTYNICNECEFEK